MMADNLAGNLLKLLESLKNKEVFYVYCGESTGSVLDIHFSPVIPRPKALENPFLSRLHRENMGTLSLFIECSWRLQAANRIVAGSGDVISDLNDFFLVVRQLEGMLVTNVKLPELDEVLDITLFFQNGLQLSLFCDSGISQRDNYTIFHGVEVLCVASGYELRSES